MDKEQESVNRQHVSIYIHIHINIYIISVYIYWQHLAIRGHCVHLVLKLKWTTINCLIFKLLNFYLSVSNSFNTMLTILEIIVIL